MSLDEILRAARERSPVGIAESIERERTESLRRDDDNVGECRRCECEEVCRNENDLCIDCADYCDECECDPCECEENARRSSLEHALDNALSNARELLDYLETAYSLNEDCYDTYHAVRDASTYLQDCARYVDDALGYT